jgi:hypothetical protein
VRFGPDVSDLMQRMLFTPETSGGLLVSLPEGNLPQFFAACPGSVVIGDIRQGPGLVVVD